ncbi:hypothetical protein TcWFU_004532 [Taenia crassiceps]|uniref:Uncharacterized protein n=1 Tax=Taenia crassiceps TaxID=6207 RepID=A0ABR4Q796_9CEST
MASHPVLHSTMRRRFTHGRLQTGLTSPTNRSDMRHQMLQHSSLGGRATEAKEGGAEQSGAEVDARNDAPTGVISQPTPSINAAGAAQVINAGSVNTTRTLTRCIESDE